MHFDFTWVDDYFRRVKPYLYVREADMLLIKRPNHVQKLNKTGTLILKSLLNGMSVDELLRKTGSDMDKRQEIHNFLSAIKQSVDGSIDVFSTNPAVTSRPFTGNINVLPVLSELAVTYRCNLRCAFCYAGCHVTANPIGHNAELPTEALCGIIKKIYEEAQVPSISFTGGEPVLRNDLPELIAYAKSLGMRVNLISNGTLITLEKAEQLAKAGLDSAQISIEGTDSSTHDAITGMSGAFHKALNAIGFLKGCGIHTHTNTTLNGRNIGQIKQFPAFVKDTLNHNKFSMNMIIPSGSGAVDKSLWLRYSEMGPHLDVLRAESEKAGVEFMWYSPLPVCMYNTITHGLGNKGCAACDGLLSVAPDGSILPCSSYSKVTGNLHKQAFSEAWHTEEAVYFRNKNFAHPYCRACEHFALCHGGCPLYWQQMGFDELESIINPHKTL